MPKTLPGSIAIELAKQYGTKPITIVSIDWGGTVGLKWYCDTDYNDIKGYILNVGSLASLVKLGGGSTGNIQLTLDDNSGELKTIINTIDAHKRPCTVYLAYQDMAFDDKALLFSGQISTPLTWTDHPRQLTFSVVAKIEDKEIGFSPEQHAFKYIADDAVGKAWPLVFGSVLRYPAVKVTENVRGTNLVRYNVLTSTDIQEIWEAAMDYAKATRAKEMYDSGEVLRRKNISTDLDYEIQEASTFDYDEIINEYNDTHARFLQAIDILATKSYELVYRIRDFAWAAYRYQYYGLILIEMQRLLVFFNQEIQTITLLTLPRLQKEIEAERKNKDQDMLKIIDLMKEITALEKKVKQYRLSINGTPPDSIYRSTKPDYDAFGQFLGYIYDDGTPGLNWYIYNLQAEILVQQRTLLSTQTALMQVYLDVIEIDGGDKFPQGEVIDILINEARFRGTFNGRMFTIGASFLATDSNVKIAGRLDNSSTTFWLESSAYLLKDKFCLIRVETADYITNKIVFVHEQIGKQCNCYTIMWAPSGTSEILVGAEGVSAVVLETCPLLPARWITNVDTGALSGLLNLPNIEWGMEIGDTIYLAEDYKEIYVVALNPVEEIVEVMARRSVNGVAKLLPIPSRYYIKDLAYSIGGKTVPVLIFPRPLPQYIDEEWSDEVFVSVKETAIGSNTVDIIEWLAEEYAELTSDVTTRDHVHDAIVKYPSHFVLTERGNILNIIEDIAWQARCAVWISQGQLHYKYLAEETAPVLTITNDLIDATSLQLGISETEGLVTKFTAEWYKTLSQSKPNQVILRNNIPKYGIMEETFTFYIYNIESLVIKSATFWMIRKSNTWKRVRFIGLLPILKLEPFDIVELNFGFNLASTNPCKAIIESVSFDPNTLLLDFDLWVSVRAGEMTPYPFAWPATASQELEYPSPEDLYAGGEWNV